MDTIGIISQVFLNLLGIASVGCAAYGKTLPACIAGVAGEPFWIITAAINGQPGIILMSIIHGSIWAYGLWRCLKNRRTMKLAKA